MVLICFAQAEIFDLRKATTVWYFETADSKDPQLSHPYFIALSKYCLALGLEFDAAVEAF